MNFIELTGLFATSDIDFESLGIEYSCDDAEPTKTLVNVANITEINESTDGGCTIEFVSGQRYIFADSYDSVKAMIL